MNETPIERSERDLRCFLAAGAIALTGDDDWKAIPARDTNQPQPKRPDLPYISVLKMDTWHLGIPYRTGDEGIVTVDTGNLYSVQIHGPHAMSTAEMLSIWVRGNDAYLESHGRTSVEQDMGVRKPTFYIRNFSQSKDLTSIVNGKWEEKAVVNMEVQHRIALTQSVGQIDEVSIGVISGFSDDYEITIERE